MDAEDMLYILYTSGTTGKPKGIVHTTAGYLVGTYATTKWVFDLKEDDVYWCTADIGWVTGHSYVVYGPLANGATVLMYEGAPDWPAERSLLAADRALRRHHLLYGADGDPRVHALGHRVAGETRPRHAAPARIGRRADQPRGVDLVPREHRPRALPDRGYLVADRDRRDHDHAAARRSPAPKPGSATLPFPGIVAEIRDGQGKTVETGGGLLTLTQPWPAMLRGIYGDRERFVQQYWSRWTDGTYFTGDGARRDDDGFYWMLGRVDDVLNVAGHRLGTMEVESALVDHPKVAEAAVVGRPHEIKGQAIAAFVTVKEGVDGSPELADRAQGARRQEDRRDRAARPDPLRRRPAEDAFGEDHAPAAARHRRRQSARRHDDARGPGRRRPSQIGVRREGRVSLRQGSSSALTASPWFAPTPAATRCPRPPVSSSRCAAMPIARRSSSACARRSTPAGCPSDSSVVVWQRREGLAAHEALLDPALAPLVAAGFEIAEVLSPAEALARAVSVAGVDTTKAAVAVVSVHSRGGVIAIVSGGAVLTSRAFTWPLGSPSARSGSELLDRYVTVSQLAPMLKHFIELARPVYGVDTTSIYMCGTTGELRSLSMLLIEELDLDVETLDSADRLGPTYPEALGGAAAFQLAAAASLPRVETRQEHVEARERNAPGRSASRPIATLSAVLLAVLWSSLQLSGSSPATPFPSPAAAILDRPAPGTAGGRALAA